MKVIITGTHFTPAQATIEELIRYPKIKIYYVGRNTTREGDRSVSIESQVLPKLKVSFIGLTMGRIRRDLSLYSLLSLLKIPIGLVQGLIILLQIRPAIIVSFGGYISFPMVFWGYLLSIPIIVHEQTLVSGLSTQISSFFASRIAVSFPDRVVNKRYVLTGNPIRASIIHPQRVSADIDQFIQLAKRESKKLILVTGGNQGSHLINQTVDQIIESLDAYIIHQTGDAQFEDYQHLAGSHKRKNYLPLKWIEADDLGAIYKHVDLVISRAGINTLLELALAKIFSIVIPYPYLYNDEQVKNAQFFHQHGLCLIIDQNQLTPIRLKSEIDAVLKNLSYYKKQISDVECLVIKDSAKRLTQEILLLGEYV